jgi:hypothetical protein
LTRNSIFGWTPFPKETQSSIGNKPPTSEQIKNGQTIKVQSVKGSGTSGSDQPSAPVAQTNGSSQVQLTITSLTKSSSSLLKVSTLVSYLDQTGSCTLTLKDSNGAVIYTTSVGVQAMSSTSTCKGFDVPLSNLNPGSYVVYVAYTSADSKTYGSTEKTYVLQ